MDFIEFLGWMIFGYLMFQLVSAWITMQKLKHAINDALDAQQVTASSNPPVVARLEHVVQGTYSVVLAFDNETNKFLGQANTEQEVKTMLQTRYPSKNFVLVKEKATGVTTNQNLDINAV